MGGFGSVSKVALFALWFVSLKDEGLRSIKVGVENTPHSKTKNKLLWCIFLIEPFDNPNEISIFIYLIKYFKWSV